MVQRAGRGGDLTRPGEGRQRSRSGGWRDGEADAGSAAGVAGRPHPLIVTGDPDLLDELLRLTAEAGLVADVAPDPVAARRHYERAGLVLVGMDSASACARAGLPRRTGVVLVTTHRPAPAGAPEWRLAEALGADHVVALPTGAAWLTERLGDIATRPAG
jgi:hypothetical protein